MVTKNSGYLIQSNFGTKGNFELVVVGRSSLLHYFRNNDDPTHPWVHGPDFAPGAYSRDPPGLALIQSNFGTKGNFEVVANVFGSLQHWSRDNDDPSFPWHHRSSFASNVSFRPALIQSNFGTKGNFEVVVNVAGQLQHWSRDNDDTNLPWVHRTTFASDVRGPPALIQSNFGTTKGNFEVVVKTRGGLKHWFRNNDDPTLPWIGGSTFLSGDVAGAPALIQSNFGTKGNFELVIGGSHYFRNNDDPTLPWVHGPDVASYNGRYDLTGSALIQSNHGTKGNFEAIVPIEFGPEGGERGPFWLHHYFRNNDDPSFPWIHAGGLGAF